MSGPVEGLAEDDPVVEIVRIEAEPARLPPAMVDAVALLTASLRERFGRQLVAVVLYGSCRRHGDPHDGLIDLYAVLTHRRPGESWVAAAAGAALPPNVYYLEERLGERVVRAKLAVFTMRELQRGVLWFHPYVWGRLAQPITVFADDPRYRQRVVELGARAARRLLAEAHDLVEPADDLDQIWALGLAASYRTELRVEGPERARELVAHHADYYEAILAATRRDGSLASMPAARRARWRWLLRRVQGKPLSLLRLLKGLYTFDGGLDYIAYKLEKHSGRPIEIPDKVRRRPLVHIWGLFLRLYREGVFR